MMSLIVLDEQMKEPFITESLSSRLYDAISQNNNDLLQQIMRHVKPHIDLNTILDKAGNTLAHAAAKVGNLDILETLCGYDLDLHPLNDECENAINIAVKNSDIAMVNYLIEKGLSPDRQNLFGDSPLHIATKAGNISCVDTLCSVGALVNCLDKQGATPLHYACLNGNRQIAIILCTSGAHLSAQNKDGETPLIYAAAKGHVDCVKVLLNFGAEVNYEDKDGWTALQHSIKRHQITIALILINAGSKVNHVDMRRETPLHTACREGLLPVVQALCAYGCRMDIYNGGGVTPLHLAARVGHLEIVRCLLLAGSNPQLPSKEGVFPHVMALAQGHTAVANLITKMTMERRAMCVEQLLPTKRLLPRIKLKIMGSSASGKTTLVESMRANFISGFIRKRFKSENTCNDDSDDFFTLRQRNLPSKMSYDLEHEDYTKGIVVTNTNISGSGEFSIWDYSGYEPYYIVYDHFIGDTSCIHMVVFNLNDSYDVMRIKVMFWVNFIKARIPVREPIGYCGRPRCMGRVLLVATHADKANCSRNIKGLLISADAERLLAEVQQEFACVLDICDEIYVLVGNDALSPELKNLKIRMKEWRMDILKRLQCLNGFFEVVTTKLREWRNENQVFPIYTWNEFIDKVRSRVNQLCSEDHLKDLIQQLQYTGEVVYIECETDHDMIVLNPSWLCSHILGSILSYESLTQARNISNTSFLTESDLAQQFLLSAGRTENLIRVISALDLCTEILDAQCYSIPDNLAEETQLIYDVPFLNFLDYKDDCSEAIQNSFWQQSNGSLVNGADCLDYVYSGVEFSSPEGQLVHLFPRTQCQLRKCLMQMKTASEFSYNGCSSSLEQDCWKVSSSGSSHNKVNDQLSIQVRLKQWHHASLVTCHNPLISPKPIFELLLSVKQDDQTFLIKSRALQCVFNAVDNYITVETKTSTVDVKFGLIVFALYKDILQLIEEIIDDACPSLHYQITILDPISLKKGQIQTINRQECYIKLMQYLDMDYPERNKLQEQLSSWLTFGDSQLLSSACLTLGPALHISCLRSVVFQKLCYYLDIPDPIGRDWCLLAVKLNLTHIVPKIDNTNGWLQSRTSKLLDEWGRNVDSTMDKLIACLNELNRGDVVDLLMRYAPFYHFAPANNYSSNRGVLLFDAVGSLMTNNDRNESCV